MKLLTSLLFICISINSYAQYLIKGRVEDKLSGEPLPYVTIKAIGSGVGAVTDFDGFYEIRVSVLDFDSLEAAYLGYKRELRLVKKANEQVINFQLSEDVGEIGGVTIRPGGVNIAEIVMKKAAKRKKEHNPEKIEFYEYESYNKVQLAIDNVSDRLKKRRLYQDLEPLFDTVSAFSDTSQKLVLPVFISETMSDYYFRKFPRRTKEVIKATKIQGVGVGEESYVAQILGSTFQQYNFYDNNLYILDKDFVSPLSIQASSYYFFQLIDSVVINGLPCYQIMVTPRNTKDLVFSGMVWIDSKNYALVQLNLEITKDANLNFIEFMKIQQEFMEAEPTYWLPSKTRILINVSEFSKEAMGVIGLYYSSAKDIEINKVHEIDFYEDKVRVESDAYNKEDSYWDTARHEQITEEDKRIYKMVDSLKNQPLLQSYVQVAEILVKGFIPAGKIELGPYHYLVGYNKLEGVRFRLGLRTSPEFHKDLTLIAYGAYGLKDQQFKYGLFADYVLNRSKWAKIGIGIKNDVELIGITDEDFGTSALFDAFATFGTDQLNRSTSQRLWFEKELFKGYTQKINLTHKTYGFEQVGNFNFMYLENPSDPNSMKSDFELSTINLRGRLSHKEQFVIRRNKRLSFGNLKAPVVSLDYTHGFKDVFGGDFSFDKLGFEVWQFNSLGNLGTFEYTVKAYKVFGTLPYPALFVMRGNESIISSKISYNLMSWFEFAADQYVSLQYEHQFNGLILNRVPLINQLKWRSFINFQSVYGTMNSSNQALFPINDAMYTNPSLFKKNIPYVEVGYGIENIFKFLRIDLIHRLNYLDQAEAQSFGLKGTAVLRF